MLSVAAFVAKAQDTIFVRSYTFALNDSAVEHITQCCDLRREIVYNYTFEKANGSYIVNEEVCHINSGRRQPCLNEKFRVVPEPPPGMQTIYYCERNEDGHFKTVTGYYIGVRDSLTGILLTRISDTTCSETERIKVVTKIIAHRQNDSYCVLYFLGRDNKAEKKEIWKDGSPIIATGIGH